MRNLLSPDGSVTGFLTLAADLMILNLLWVLCSLPLVTIGASTAALYYASFKRLRHEGNNAENFFRAFRDNLKQATVLWLLIALAAAGLALDFVLLLGLVFPGKTVVVLLLAVISLLFLLTAAFVFPLQARFQNSLRGTLTSALYFSLRYPGKALLLCLPMALYTLLLFTETNLFLRLGAFLLLLGASLPIYLCTRLVSKLFEEYLSK